MNKTTQLGFISLRQFGACVGVCNVCNVLHGVWSGLRCVFNVCGLWCGAVCGVWLDVHCVGWGVVWHAENTRVNIQHVSVYAKTPIRFERVGVLSARRRRFEDRDPM